ncbi:MAG TPA: hypothetical protein VMT30_00795 [Candidatus Saccharimonadia bacterium]|nr:hypothetical protein [Candidatus Saccharimonadia bacterium]
MNRKLIEFAGWYGTVAIVLAYALVSFKIVAADSALYQLLNLTGAAGIIAISALKGVKQSVVLNGFWAAIALVALARIVL